MAYAINLSGQVFGKLTVVSRQKKAGGTSALWVCSCICGGSIVTRSSSLRRGFTQSCGCRGGGRLREEGRIKAQEAGEPFYTGRPCTNCSGTKRRTSSGSCYECHKKQKRETYHRHAAEYASKSRQWVRENKSKAQQTRRSYAVKNRPLLTHLQTLRYTRQKSACPDWVDMAELHRIYEECPKGYQVDHIHPLSSKVLSGLHVPWNLWYLPTVINIKKRNKILDENELAQLPGIYPRGYAATNKCYFLAGSELALVAATSATGV